MVVLTQEEQPPVEQEAGFVGHFTNLSNPVVDCGDNFHLFSLETAFEGGFDEIIRPQFLFLSPFAPGPLFGFGKISILMNDCSMLFHSLRGCVCICYDVW